MNKKANTTWFIISFIMTFLTFLLVAKFLGTASSIVVSEGDDLTCRSFISVKSEGFVQITEEVAKLTEADSLVKGLNMKCKTDYVKSKAEGKEEVFEEIATEALRCWYRYGEGGYDFMSAFGSEGNFCFTCGKIEFKKDSNVYDYSRGENSFIEWLSQKKGIDSKGETYTYDEYLSMKFAVQEDGEQIYKDLAEAMNEIDEAVKDSDSTMKPFLLMLDKERESYFDLLSKEINTDEDLYVVYRYDGLPPSYWETLGVSVGSLMVTVGAEWAVETVTVATVGLLTGGIGSVAGIIGTTIKAVFRAVSVSSKSKKIEAVIKIGKSISKGVEFTGKAKKAARIFDGTVESLRKTGEALSKTNNDLSKKVLIYAQKLETRGVTKIDDLDSLIKNTEESKKLLDDTFVIISDLTKVKTGNDLKALQTLKKEGEEISAILDSGKQLTDTDWKKIRIFEKTSAAVLGTYLVADTVDYSSNTVQYVDILTKEQYYRLCGTEPKSFEKSGIFA